MFAAEGWSFRRAVSADADEIGRLVRAVYAKYVPIMGREPQPMTVDYGVAVRDHQVWVLLDGERLLAALVLVADAEGFLLENVAIAAELQGTGFGSRLLAFAEAEAARQGFAEIRLYTNEKMGGNVAFYGRRGYEETHREPFGATQVVHMKKRVA